MIGWLHTVNIRYLPKVVGMAVVVKEKEKGARAREAIEVGLGGWE